MAEERCICCGEIIPEGRMVCPNCLVSNEGKEKHELPEV
jgi:RNA polymerase subunit RPABC4/transcription elongation factor Spt4